jgi:hypothetical protein
MSNQSQNRFNDAQTVTFNSICRINDIAAIMSQPSYLGATLCTSQDVLRVSSEVLKMLTAGPYATLAHLCNPACPPPPDEVVMSQWISVLRYGSISQRRAPYLEKVYRTKNKEAVGCARILFQYCQLPDKNSLRETLGIFRRILKCLYIYPTISRGTPNDILWNPGWETPHYRLFFVQKGPAAEATDAPQP